MRFELLGPLVLERDGGEKVALAGPRLRVLLATLLLHGSAPVSSDALAEAVWDGAPPPEAVSTLRSYVRRLRRALGPAAGTRIVARNPGYLIRVAEPESDVLEFEALCRDAGLALQAGTWDAAADAAARALGLWRGAPLLDVPSQVLRDRFVPRLEQLRLQVLEDDAEARLRLGGHERMVPALRELAGAYPLRERFHVQLMTALARSGRRAEALDAYQHVRKLLVGELGIEPGPELRAVHERILAGESEPPATVSGDAAPPAEITPPRASIAAAVPRQLPAAPRHFTGRHAELDRLVAVAQGSGAHVGTVVISAIDGMAGVGKTALAIHAAHRLAGAYPDGQLFVDLHGYTEGQRPRSAEQALGWLLRALGVPAERIPKESEQAAALYRQRLAGTRTLIVLDNAAQEAQVRPLLPGAEGCLVLVTSRRRLKGLDDAHSVSLDVLAAPDAVALLRAVAGPDRVPDGDPRAGEVAQLCGYLPLALRIAAALLRHRPAWCLQHLAGLLREQHRRIPALSDGDRDLGTVFDLSYRSLTADQQRAFRRLGLVPGPDLDAYAAAALTDTDPATAAGLLEDLVDHNLLIAYVSGRYRLHDLIRAHARALAATDPEPDRADALDRLLHYYAHTAQSASVPIARHPRPQLDDPAPAHTPALADAEAARAWLRTELPNLDAAFAHAHTRGLDEHAIALAAALAEFLQADGPFARALQIHQSAAETAERLGHPAAHANALTALGRARSVTGDYPGACDALTRALEIYRVLGLGNRLGEAAALNELGRVRSMTGDYPGAGDALTRALELCRGLGNRLGEAYALNELGRVRRLTGDYAGAGDAHARALELCRGLGNRLGEAAALNDLGRVRSMTGDYPGAGDALTRALELYRALGNRLGEANALTHLGHVRHMTGDYAGAGDALTRALELYRALGNRSNEAWALNHYAATLAASGELPRALALYQQALAMNRELNKPDDEAVSLEGIAEHHLAAGDPTQGAAHLRQALEIYQRLGMAPDARRVQDQLNGLTPGGVPEEPGMNCSSPSA